MAWFEEGTETILKSANGGRVSKVCRVFSHDGLCNLNWILWHTVFEQYQLMFYNYLIPFMPFLGSAN